MTLMVSQVNDLGPAHADNEAKSNLYAIFQFVSVHRREQTGTLKQILICAVRGA